MLHKSPALLNIGLATLARYLDSQPLLNLTAHEYLWGYDDPLVRLASTILPNWIPFSKLGLMDRVSGPVCLQELVTPKLVGQFWHNSVRQT